MDDYEWIPTIHSDCGGQGCTTCGPGGEIMVRVDVQEYVA